MKTQILSPAEVEKAAGILTEAAVDMEDEKLDYAILGIGVNVYPPKGAYPKELRDIATPLFAERAGFEGIRSQIIARILEYFLPYYQNLTQKEYYDVYRKKSLVLNRSIQIKNGSDTWQGFAMDLDKDFHLIVQKKDGQKQTLTSGEIRILS